MYKLAIVAYLYKGKIVPSRSIGVWTEIMMDLLLVDMVG